MTYHVQVNNTVTSTPRIKFCPENLHYHETIKGKETEINRENVKFF